MRYSFYFSYLIIVITNNKMAIMYRLFMYVMQVSIYIVLWSPRHVPQCIPKNDRWERVSRGLSPNRSHCDYVETKEWNLLKIHPKVVEWMNFRPCMIIFNKFIYNHVFCDDFHKQFGWNITVSFVYLRIDIVCVYCNEDRSEFFWLWEKCVNKSFINISVTICSSFKRFETPVIRDFFARNHNALCFSR